MSVTSVFDMLLMVIICEFSGKSFISNTQWHTGKSSCPKCHVKGKKIGTRMCFAKLNCTPRTDKEIRLQMKKYNSDNP